MKLHTHTLSLAALAMALLASCGDTQSADELRNVEQALAQGDMTAARSVAEKLIAGNSLDKMSATELARLSMAYMEMADREEDNTALVATAADLYRRACRENADSAALFFRSLPHDDELLAAQLRHIVAATDSTGVMPPEEPVDTIH